MFTEMERSKMIDEKRSVKLSENLYKVLKSTANKEGKLIGWYLDRSVFTYLKRRKINVA